MLAALKLGSAGTEVEKWQYFLRGLNLYKNEIDGQFGAKTNAATIAFQKKHVVTATGSKFDADGIVGNHTYGVASTKFGYQLIESDSELKTGPNWPPKPANIKPLSPAEREQLFGKIAFVPAPTPGNPEGIKITNDWAKENLTKVVIPQLKGVQGAPKNCTIFWHKKGTNQIVGLFKAWEDAKLMDRVLTWGGSWAPRFIRGSRTTLSNHAHSVAFDINVAWNGLGQQGALVGRKGSIRELIPLAVEYGFYSGLWFARQDAMHFEICKIK